MDLPEPCGYHLDVGDGHRLWVQRLGTPGEMPAVYLHGGPGSGCQPSHAALFDQRHFDLVLVDQRGAGLSLPKAARHANTTADLIADLERLRDHCGFARWLVVGGSWGATLALAYAQAHPGRVTGLVLRAVFLGTRAEIDWAFGEGLRRFYPALHADFLAVLPAAERVRPVDAYIARILDPDPAIHAPAARAWGATERILSQHRPGATRLGPATDPAAPLPRTPFIEAHYFAHGCFLADDALLVRAGRLDGIPGVIVQGRHDLLCPPVTAHGLAARWPGARLEIVEAAGHSLSDPGVAEAVRAAIAGFAG